MRLLRNFFSLGKTNVSKQIPNSVVACPHLIEAEQEVKVVKNDCERVLNAKPYSAIPGPRPLPLLGNTWG